MIFHLAPIVLLYIFAKIGTSLISEDDSDRIKLNEQVNSRNKFLDFKSQNRIR